MALSSPALQKALRIDFSLSEHVNGPGFGLYILNVKNPTVSGIFYILP
jgi:hypothetical protein